MSNVAAIILLIVLAGVLFLLLRVLIPAFSDYIKQLPKSIFVVLFLVVISAMGYLVYHLVNSFQTGGEIGTASQETAEPAEEGRRDVTLEKMEDCIILRENQIWIENVQVGMPEVEKYIDEHVESNTRLTIIDDYALASLHHEITELCERKGVNYSNENEKQD